MSSSKGMPELSTDEETFVRSLLVRASLGGLSLLVSSRSWLSIF
jgi:hypothetical protein